MTPFLLLSGLLLAAAYLLFVPVLRNRTPIQAAKPEQQRLALYRQRREELEREWEWEQGNLERAVYEQLNRELDLQWLDDGEPQATTPTTTATAGRWPIVAVLAILPLVAYGLYSQLGRPELLDAHPAAESDAEVMENHIQRLNQHLAAHPDDVQGWMLLGRSQQLTRHAAQALAAYQKAVDLAPDNLDIKVLYAEALAENQDNRLQGRPAEIVAEILRADAHHPAGLWLAGLAAAERGDAPGALEYWRRLKTLTPPDSDDAKQLDGYIAMLTGQATPLPATRFAIKVRVSLAPSLAGQAQPEDAVFVFAKAASGSPMPLAVVRKQVKDLPLEAVLDDTAAVSSNAGLSTVPQVVLGARIAKSGRPTASPGDLQGFSAPLAPVSGQTYDVEIDRTVN